MLGRLCGDAFAQDDPMELDSHDRSGTIVTTTNAF